jgi:transcription elongation factor Elf1
MSFTPKERQQWLEDKRKREHEEDRKRAAVSASAKAAHQMMFTCLHCNNQFSVSEGVSSQGVFICDTCNY